jgi:hypothetical protein
MSGPRARIPASRGVATRDSAIEAENPQPTQAAIAAVESRPRAQPSAGCETWQKVTRLVPLVAGPTQWKRNCVVQPRRVIN